MGRNGSRQVLACSGRSRAADARTGGQVDGGGSRPGRPRSRRAAARSSGWCRRRPPTCSTSRPSPRSARPADGGTGACRRRSSTGWCPASPTTSTRATCPRGSGWRWRWRSCSSAGRGCCCSTSRPAGSTTPPSPRWPASCATLADDGHGGAGGDPRRGVRGPGRRRRGGARRRRGRLRAVRCAGWSPSRRRSPRRSPRCSARRGWGRRGARRPVSGAVSAGPLRCALSPRSRLVLGVASLGRGLMMLCWPLLLRVPPARRGSTRRSCSWRCCRS